jgi:hypothetical protein
VNNEQSAMHVRSFGALLITRANFKGAIKGKAQKSQKELTQKPQKTAMIFRMLAFFCAFCAYFFCAFCG